MSFLYQISSASPHVPAWPGHIATGIESRVVLSHRSGSGYGSPMSIVQESSPRHCASSGSDSPMSVVLDTHPSPRLHYPSINADQLYYRDIPLREDQRQLQEPDSLRTLLTKRADLDLTSEVIDIGRSQQTHGGSSDIFIGYLCNPGKAPTKVAVKRLRVHIMQNEKAQKMIARELYIWSKLDHPNVLPLKGFFVEDNGYPSLVSKWMENGPVIGYLTHHPEADILNLIAGIASAVSYLHRQQIVHSDIKPDNILISEYGEPVLCDFGFARMMESSRTFDLGSTSSMNGGTPRFMAKELFEATDSETSIFTKESDIWAFGMTVFALLTRSLPYAHLRLEGRVITAIMKGELPRRPADIGSWPSCNVYIWEWCTRCWDASPSRRPPIEAIIRALKFAKQSHHLLSLFPPT